MAWLATAVGGLALALWGLWPVSALEIANATTHQTIARLAVAGDAPLRLTYRHSIYRAPAAEEFAVGEEGLDLVRLASPSPAVLEYYARSEPIVASGAGYEIRLAPERHAALALLASELGQRTVAYAGHELPLHHLAADGHRVTLRVVRAPRVTLLWSSPP